MERDRGVSRERSEHIRTVEHVRSVQARNTTVFPISRAEQEGAGVPASQSRRDHGPADELAVGCLYERVRGRRFSLLSKNTHGRLMRH